MRSLCVTPAIVLRSWPFGESDKIVSFLTENYGKVTGIAKGASRSRKRFVNTLEPFSLVHLRFQERPHSSLAFVHACDLMRTFKDLTANLEKIAYAFYLLEITNELTGEREENRPLFEHLKEALIFLEEEGASAFFLVFFKLRLLKLSGYQPMLEQCHRCRKECKFGVQAQWRFSPRDGGILCESCSSFRRELIPLSLEALHALREIQKMNRIPPAVSPYAPSALTESRSFLSQFIQFQINKELKSASFLNAFSSG